MNFGPHINARLASRNEDDNRFAQTPPTLNPVTGENLDVPTFLRQGIEIREIESNE